MANWEHVYDLTGVVSSRGKVATDGTYIYYWDEATGIYRYNSNDNSDELWISNSDLETEAQSLIPGQAIVSTTFGHLVCFSQQIYAGVYYQYEFSEAVYHTRHVVFRVTSGTPDQVDFIDLDDTDLGTSTEAFGLYSGETYISHFVDPYGRKSVNGSSWTDLAQPIFDTGTGLESVSFPRDFRSTGIYMGVQDDVYLFNGSQWVKQGNLDGSISSTLIDGKDDVWITRHDANEYTDDNFATFDLPLTDNSLFAAVQLNMPYVVAHKPNDFDSSFSELYYFDGSDFQLLDTTDAGPPFWSIPTGGNTNSKLWLIRLDNGGCYALTRNGLTWDVWHRDEDLPATPGGWASPPPEKRYIGMDRDSTNLYLTGIEDGALTLWIHPLNDLANPTFLTFGMANFTDPDDLIRGIFPLVKPGTDGIVFLYGRDGDEVALQRSDDSGETFTDLDDGSWGGTKYIVAMMPDPLRPDELVAVFSDNDLYQSSDNGQTWAKIADAPATLRAAARQPITARNMLLAAQAVDTVFVTGNLGLTTQDVSDPALGTVKVIVPSR